VIAVIRRTCVALILRINEFFGRIHEGGSNKVTNKTSLRIMMALALLMLVIPATASAQFVYQRDYDRSDRSDRSARSDRSDRREVREAINRLDSTSARLQSDLNTGRNRRVLGGLFLVRNVDESAIAEVRNFRDAVRDLRRNFRQDAWNNSAGEARVVIDRGMQLDRYLRLRTANSRVDGDLAELRSNLHLLADVYGLSLRY
jgi:hypothetical protein